MKDIKTFIVSILVVLILPGIVVLTIFMYFSERVESECKLEISLKADHIPAVDHTTFEILKKEFSSPQEVTEACISCHTERDDEIMSTAHWKWERTEEVPGRGVITIGKKNLLNNFCTGATGNNGSCMRCHIGYGWKDKNFDFADSRNVDCLVCHDQTNTYFKQKGKAGMPATAETANVQYQVPNYSYVSQHVGLPKKENCGICHFFGGGGNNVKHGDLEEALLNCSREVDVHMSSDSLNMACIDCHRTERHLISGKSYSVSSANKDRVTCEQCHTNAPHQDRILDEHNIKIACQTCHIPTYAKANATKMYWNWSSAGMINESGKPYLENDADGNHNYLSIKGNFVWDDHVVPEYYWFNGTADHYLSEDTISEIPVKINTLFGEYKDPEAKIWPVKVHRGKQIYDTENNYLIHLKLHAEDIGQGAFWKDFNWDTAAYLGMKYNDRTYSGKYGFIDSEVYWPINHQVAPKEQTLKCTECHARESRLAVLTDFYLPGRDYANWVDKGGIALIFVSIIGVIGHGMLRVFTGIIKKRNNS